MGAKHKKTRKQKVIADFNRKKYILKNIDNTSILTTAAITINQDSRFNSYSYVLHDVLKTGLLTLSIVAGELILFFLLKNHIITLPMFKY